MAKFVDHTSDATKPFYASLGAADLAVELARRAADDLQARMDGARTRLADLDRDPRALAELARTQMTTGLGTANKQVDALQADLRQLPKQTQARVAELQSGARELPAQAQRRLAELQDELKALPGKVELRFDELQDELKALYAKVETQIDELATRGQSRVAKLRDDSISGDVEIIRDDAVVVKEVDADVEAAAAAAAAQAEDAAQVAAVKPAKKTAPKKPRPEKA